MPSKRGFSGSQYFRLDQVADGVYAAVAIPGAGAWGNAGIVDLGGRTLVFDTFATPQAARDLRTAAELLTGRPAAYVVNSHRHADHVLGNQVFTDAVVLATTITRNLMATQTAGFLAAAREHPERLDFLTEQVLAEPEDGRRRELALELGELKQIAAALPGLTLRLPEVTFDHHLCLHGSQRTVELLSYGGGHTASDTFLWVPDVQVAFMGDLVQVGCHPMIKHGDYREWVNILERVQALPIAHLVPGHGPVSGAGAAGELREYFLMLERLARELLNQGGCPDGAKVAAIPEGYRAWNSPSLFGENLQQIAGLLALA